MKKLITLLVATTIALMAPVAIALADTGTVSVTTITPGTSVYAKDSLTFHITTTGFTTQLFNLTDSFPNSTASVSNISGGGNFFWVPVASDAGTHTFTITASDYNGNSAVTTQTITVLPVPSITIQSLSPGASVSPGMKTTFVVVSNGFTNPTFSISDPFSDGSSVSNNSIDSSGNFSWTPDTSQNGDHTISIYASDATGHHASASQSIHVGGFPTLIVSPLSPGTVVPVGTTTTFAIASMNYIPSIFGVSDTFVGSSISNNNISSNGQFSWLTEPSDIGVHTLTIKGSVGPYGQSTTTKQVIVVYAAGTVPPPMPSTVTAPAVVPPPVIIPAPATVIAPTPSTSSGQAVTGAFTLTLQLGSKGDEVTHLQNVLAGLGLFTGTPSGYYGALTAAAVVKFQAAHGLPQVGIVGAQTRAVLNGLSGNTTTTVNTPPVTTSSSDGYKFNNFIGFGEDTTDGSDVMELQKRLIAGGFLSGNATGYFGSATQAAVSKYQTAHSIPATGFVGSLTRAALNQ